MVGCMSLLRQVCMYDVSVDGEIHLQIDLSGFVWLGVGSACATLSNGNFFVFNVLVQELELPSIMASLDICEDHDVKNAPSPAQDHKQTFYKLRARQSSSSESNRKRRCQLKPSKLNTSLSSNHSDYYMNKFKHKPSRLLETIYEEPVALKNGRIKHMGGSKPRKVQFSGITKAKIKHRRMKLKTSSCRERMQRKINMDEFIARFHKLMGTKETHETEVMDSSTNTASSIS